MNTDYNSTQKEGTGVIRIKNFSDLNLKIENILKEKE